MKVDTKKSTPLQQLVEYSRRLGADDTLVLSGGGNTSVKAIGTDVAGRPIDILYIKGSGSDLAAVQARDFAPLRLEDLLVLRDRAGMTDEEMVEWLLRCKLDPAAPRPSIETLLHAFIPAASVFHSHADAILSIINTPDPIPLLKQVFGDSVEPVAYQRPGFRLSVDVGAAAARPGVEAVVLLNHGLVTWGDSPEAAYEAHLRIVEQARAFLQKRGRSTSQSLQQSDSRAAAVKIAPRLRGALSRSRRVIVVHDDSPPTMAFVNSPELRNASAAGAVTPDHILTTKRLPLWIDDGSPEAIRAALDQYASEYASYVQRHRTDEPLLENTPRIILVPGVGMFTAGANRKSAVLAADIYRHTMQIIEAAAALGGYRSLEEKEGFRAEYWPLELYKLTIAPPERELARRVALVTGAASGLGRAVAQRLGAAGAHVLVTDIDDAAARDTADAINTSEGKGTATSLPLDVTRESSVQAAFESAILEFGGIDIVVSNAGFAHCAPLVDLKLADWERSFAVNSTGHFLVTRAALRLFKEQNIGGNIVFVVTKNVTAPGRDFAAYSASKSAEAQLARVAAIEGAEFGVRVNMVNPDAIFAGSHLWDDIRERRAATHGISPEEVEAHYRKRSLLGLEVRAEDVAEAVLFLASDRSSRTTGCMLPVDSGVREAFVR